MEWAFIGWAQLVRTSFAIGPFLIVAALVAGWTSVVTMLIRAKTTTHERSQRLAVLRSLLLTVVGFVAFYWLGENHLFSDSHWEFWQDSVPAVGVIVGSVALGSFSATAVWRGTLRGWSTRRAVARDLMASVIVAWILYWIIDGPGSDFAPGSRLYVAISIGLLVPPTLAFAARAVRSLVGRPNSSRESTATSSREQILVLVALCVGLAGVWSITPRSFIAPGDVTLIGALGADVTTFTVSIGYRTCSNGEQVTEDRVRSFDVTETDESIVIRTLVTQPRTLGSYTCEGAPPRTVFRTVTLQAPLTGRAILVDRTFLGEETIEPAGRSPRRTQG